VFKKKICEEKEGSEVAYYFERYALRFLIRKSGRELGVYL
jgi:hypothetical protein